MVFQKHWFSGHRELWSSSLVYQKNRSEIPDNIRGKAVEALHSLLFSERATRSVVFIEVVMNYVIPWKHDLREVKDWLFANAGDYGKDWSIWSRWVGYEEAGSLEHTVRIDDERVAALFVLRWL